MSILERMAADLPIGSSELAVIAATSPRRYKVYEVPKRNGSGMRVIAQPSPEVKLLQRWVVARLLRKLPVHRSAIAYIKDKNIVAHAKPHANKRFLLKMDFRNFFNSIKIQHVKNFLVEKCKLSDSDAAIVANVLIWKNKETGDLCVSVGAPSSPGLTNAMLFEFDKAVSLFCKEQSITYTRYADDLAFSTNKKNVLEKVPALVFGALTQNELSHLSINKKKTVSTSKRYKRTLVGLTLTPDGKVSLGRDKKRELRAQLHALQFNDLPATEVASLRGMLAYAWSIEPVFVKAMVARYGVDLFLSLDLEALCQ